MTERRRFPNAPDSVAAARRFALRVLQDLSGEVTEAIQLMVSELATNCVRHAESSFDISIARSKEQIRVEATDHAGGEPQLLSPAPSDPHGRGLLIVDMLSADWGIRQREGTGKTVWFTVSLREPANR